MLLVTQMVCGIKELESKQLVVRVVKPSAFGGMEAGQHTSGHFLVPSLLSAS